MAKIEKECTECGGKEFRLTIDTWMKRTFKFVEDAAGLYMCGDCGAKYLACEKCGTLMTRVHPALETWEVISKCPNPDCDYEDSRVKAWDGVSAR